VATADDSGAATLSLDHEKAAAFLAEKTADIRKEPSDAEFEEQDGKVTKFVPHVNGEAVDAEAVVALLTDSAFRTVIDGETSSRIEMPLTVVEPEITTEKSNPYGIKEIIGIGASNFRGSPANRRHNIAIGAKSVWGTLVPAGEEFSMIKTLGVIDGTTGYKQELVIKENRTTPEYGGGLCQIGSTAFRAALDSGLPITMRKNHSYRVPYYERDGDGNNIGPGKDATIYDPLPDFRFANDTAHAMLITTKITGDKVEFFFWGVKDGRVAEQTKARVYNIVAPPPTKIIQTTDLPIGQKKCTESAHVGSNASFDYKVTMANGEVREKEFVSYYRPWQEVCLVGVDPATLPPGVTSQELPSPDSTAVDAPAGTVSPATPAPTTPAPTTPAPTTP
jgi:vancomycin resistance protein YoaR